MIKVLFLILKLGGGILRWCLVTAGMDLGQTFAYIIKSAPPRSARLTTEITNQYLNGLPQNELGWVQRKLNSDRREGFVAQTPPSRDWFPIIRTKEITRNLSQWIPPIHYLEWLCPAKHHPNSLLFIGINTWHFFCGTIGSFSEDQTSTNNTQSWQAVPVPREKN